MTSTTQGRGPVAITDGDTILATAIINALPEDIFRALNTKEVEIWWGSPDTYQIKNWNAELTVGGRWTLDIVKGGATLPSSGVFLEIDAPHRIVFTRRYDFDFPMLGWRDTRVTYQLKAESAGTRLTVRQDGFAHLGAGAEQHAEGWERFLQFLQSYLPGATASAAA